MFAAEVHARVERTPCPAGHMQRGAGCQTAQNGPDAEKIPCMENTRPSSRPGNPFEGLPMPDHATSSSHSRSLHAPAAPKPAKSPKDCLVPDASQALTTTTPAGQDGWEGEWQGKT